MRRAAIEQRRRDLQLEIARTELQWAAQRGELRGDVSAAVLQAIAHRLMNASAGKTAFLGVIAAVLAALRQRG